jgi:hypothetical protein
MSDVKTENSEAKGKLSPVVRLEIPPTVVIDARGVPRACPNPALDALELQNRLKLRTMICWFLLIERVSPGKE